MQTAQALYFGPSGMECFGWLHTPGTSSHTSSATPTHKAARTAAQTAARADLGLVICSPFGREDQATHRGLRHLAMLAAGAGIATLRFDYHGCGDSPGADGDHDHPSAWLASTHAAIDTLRERSGVTRVCLLGVRLGVIAAAQAASERGDVAALVALAPVVRGRGFLREAMLRGAHLSANAPANTTLNAPVNVPVNASVNARANTSVNVSVEAPGGAPADFELGGHVVTARARAELAAIDLVHVLDLAHAPPADVLVVDADNLNASERWRAELAARGAHTERFCAPALAAMIESTGDAIPPHALLAAVVGWIADRAAATGHAPLPPIALPPPMSTLQRDGVRETPLTVRVDTTDLFAVLSEPTAGTVRCAVLLLNTGNGRRIGPSRLHVNWARQWARDGVAVLRVDLPGLGDSEVAPGETEAEVYAIETVPAITAALALLRARTGAVECGLLGICSGAFHAYRAAVAGVPVDLLVLINQAAYRWHAGMHLDRPSLALRLAWVLKQRAMGRLAAASLRPRRQTWSRMKWLAVHGGKAAFGLARDAARGLRLPLPQDVGAAMASLARRKVAMNIVFADDDIGAALLRLEAGRAVAAMRARGALQIDVIAGADHIFTSKAARVRIAGVLDRIVHGRSATQTSSAQESVAQTPVSQTPVLQEPVTYKPVA